MKKFIKILGYMQRNKITLVKYYWKMIKEKRQLFVTVGNNDDAAKMKNK